MFAAYSPYLILFPLNLIPEQYVIAYDFAGNVAGTKQNKKINQSIQACF